MKLAVLTALLALVMVVFGWTKKALLTRTVFSLTSEGIEVPIDSIPQTASPLCHIEGPVVMRLQEAEGYIDYREGVGLWYISYVKPLPPGAVTDSEYSGFVCNMPNEYKQKGLKVRFSGQYYHAWKYIKKAHAGGTPLYLLLTILRKA